MTFDAAFDILLRHEGCWSDHPADPGGKTMFGITEAVARRHGYLGEMQHMPLTYAKRIYRQAYWEKLRCEEMPVGLRYALFDCGVNSGPGQAVRFLQRALGVAPDGNLGPVTLLAALRCDVPAVRQHMIGQRLQFLTQLTTWEHFGRGWARRIASVLQDA